MQFAEMLGIQRCTASSVNHRRLNDLSSAALAATGKLVDGNDYLKS